MIVDMLGIYSIVTFNSTTSNWERETNNLPEMNIIIEFLDFFGAIEVEFVYYGTGPMNKSDLYSCDWEFKFFNGKDEMEFDSETRRFSNEVKNLQDAINVVPIKALHGYERKDLILALAKAENLRSKIVFREVSNFEQNETIWYFAGNEVIKAFMQYEQPGGSIKIYERSFRLIQRIEEILSIDIQWLKDILESLIPLLRIAIDTIVPGAVRAKKEIEIPNNFVSKKFQPDVVNSLFEQFVQLGYLSNGLDQKKSFLKAFSTKKSHKEIFPKIAWKGAATVLRGFIFRLGEIEPSFENLRIRSKNWLVADKVFKLQGDKLSKEGSNGHYGSKEAIKKITNAVNNALRNLDPSE